MELKIVLTREATRLPNSVSPSVGGHVCNWGSASPIRRQTLGGQVEPLTISFGRMVTIRSDLGRFVFSFILATRSSAAWA